MTTASATNIESITSRLGDSSEPEQLFAALEDLLLEQRDYHRLFDVRLMKARHQLGLPVTQPASLDDIPLEHQAEFREAYMDAARDAGRQLLENGQLADAWAYFRTIGEPEPVREAIDRVSIPQEPDEAFDEIMNLALYEGAHFVRGLEFLLKTHGTCNTVTTYSQLQQQMTSEERRQAAALLVQQIYSDLQYSLKSDVESRSAAVSADASIRELMSGQDVVFAEGNYHIDVSHLHSIVGFARSLTSEDPELLLAIELCEYGARLSEPLRYPGNPPFEDYYAGHLQFLNAVAGKDREQALEWLTQQMHAQSEDAAKRLVAFVILDLGQRSDQEEASLASVAPVLSRLEEPGGFSFTTLCVEQNRLDLLEQTAKTNDDVLSWATARLSALK